VPSYFLSKKEKYGAKPKMTERPQQEETERLLWCPDCLDKQWFRYDPKTEMWICQVCGKEVTEYESEDAEDEEDDETDLPAYGEDWI
jgi:ribosomal protein L37AE/L43A